MLLTYAAVTLYMVDNLNVTRMKIKLVACALTEAHAGGSDLNFSPNRIVFYT